MTSADFSQFVVTTVLCEPPVRPPRVLTRSFPLIPAAFTEECSVQLLDFSLLCNLIHIFSLICDFCSSGQSFAVGRGFPPRRYWLPSDSASRRTPLPLANASRCRARSGLSPYRTCARRAQHKQGEDAQSGVLALFFEGCDCRKGRGNHSFASSSAFFALASFMSSSSSDSFHSFCSESIIRSQVSAALR